MKILHLSDTHGCHRRLRDLPEADVVIHSGDFTMNGSEAEAKFSSAETTTTACMKPALTGLTTM